MSQSVQQGKKRKLTTSPISVSSNQTKPLASGCSPHLFPQGRDAFVEVLRPLADGFHVSTETEDEDSIAYPPPMNKTRRHFSVSDPRIIPFPSLATPAAPLANARTSLSMSPFQNDVFVLDVTDKEDDDDDEDRETRQDMYQATSAPNSYTSSLEDSFPPFSSFSSASSFSKSPTNMSL